MLTKFQFASTRRQLHDSLHDVVVVSFQRTDCPPSGTLYLRHDQLNVFAFDPLFINVVIFIIDLFNCWLLLSPGFWHSELLSSRSLGLRTEILNFCLTKDNVSVAIRSFVNVRLGNDKKYVLALLHCHAYDTGDELHTKLLHCLAALLF